MKYALKTQFIWDTWEYVGSVDGKRLLYDTREEAQADLESTIRASNGRENIEEWLVVEYNEADDTKSDLL